MGASPHPQKILNFSKPCEDISRDFWEEFSRKKLPDKFFEIFDIQKNFWYSKKLNKIDNKINS